MRERKVFDDSPRAGSRCEPERCHLGTNPSNAPLSPGKRARTITAAHKRPLFNPGGDTYIKTWVVANASLTVLQNDLRTLCIQNLLFATIGNR